MNKIPAYPKIFQLGDRNIPNILFDEVEVTEKIDGSQFSFGVLNGELLCRSKNKHQNIFAPDKLFQSAVDYIRSIEHRLYPDCVYYAETLSKPKHNTIKYDRIPENNLALFGLMTSDKKFVSHGTLQYGADRLDIEVVPLLYKGRVTTQVLIDFVEKEKSFLGDVPIEGVVVKNLKRGFELFGNIYPFTTGKYVSEAFKEMNHKAWKDEKPRNQIGALLTATKTKARWEKARQYLEEMGTLEHAPKDIGPLCKRVQQDLLEEEKENIKEDLWNIYKKDFERACVHGLAEWWKKELLKKTLNNTIEEDKYSASS